MNTYQIKPFRLNIGGTYLTPLLTFPYPSDLNPNQLLKPDPQRLSYRSKHPSDTAANPNLPSLPIPHHPVASVLEGSAVTSPWEEGPAHPSTAELWICLVTAWDIRWGKVPLCHCG